MYKNAIKIMSTILILLLVVNVTAFATLEIKTEGIDSTTKITAINLNNGKTNIKINAKLYDANVVVKSKPISLVLLGSIDSHINGETMSIDGKIYYPYYLDQKMPDQNGNVNFDFVVKVPVDENKYKVVLYTEGLDNPQIIEEFLPPLDKPDETPMPKPTAKPGGGGGSGGGGSSSGVNAGIINEINKNTPTPKPTMPNTDGNKTFNDLPSSHWAYNEINFLIQKNIVLGDAQSNYIRPDEEISREEIAVIITKAFNYEVQDSTVKYGDNSSEWAAKYLFTLDKNNILKGDENGNYNGKNLSTRAETFTMVARSQKYDYNPSFSADFDDAQQIPDFALANIKVLVENNIINGYEDNTIRPNNYISRAEFFALITRIIK